jgi:MFS family permease
VSAALSRQVRLVGVAGALREACETDDVPGSPRGPSPLTGWLADRAGGVTVAAIGAALLVAAGGSGALLDLSDGTAMTAMLAWLGLGWNAGVVGGSTMLAGSVPAILRPQTEGIGEVAMGLAAGAGAPIAGFIVAVGSMTALTLAGAVGGLLILMALRLGEREPRDALVESSYRVE